MKGSAQVPPHFEHVFHGIPPCLTGISFWEAHWFHMKPNDSCFVLIVPNERPFVNVLGCILRFFFFLLGNTQ
jgi:hypothetical protein